MLDLERENELLTAENERLLRELRDATEKYEGIRNSLSWKITAPLRKTLDLFIKPKQTSGPQPFNDENYQRWIALFDTLTDADRLAIRNFVLPERPILSIVVTVKDDPAGAILQTIQSVRRQIYREWELCLIDNGSTAPHVARALASCGPDPRVKINNPPTNQWVAHLIPGDELSESALFEVAAAINAHPSATTIYSDEDQQDEFGHRCNPAFKTAWNPDLFRGQDYLGKLVFKRSEAGLTHHIPSILIHSPAPVQHVFSIPTRHFCPTLPSVTAIIPTRDRADLLSRALEGIFNRTTYPNLEVLILNNDSREPATQALFNKYPVKVLPQPGEFNWAAMNNEGAKAATGEILIFLNNDIDVIDPHWVQELALHAQNPETGAVGAKLLFADRTVQHAGIWLGPAGRVRHAFRLAKRDDPGYLGQLSTTRNLSAVTGACLAIRRDLFLEMDGFDASYPVSYNDLDLCLRLRQRGLNIVWTPRAELLHLESASRGSSEWRWRKEEADHKRFCAKWQLEMEHDPFFNPNLDLIGEETLALAFPPRTTRAWRT